MRKNNPAYAPAMDEVDRRILSALRADGRLTVNDLSARVGLSASPCWTRVKRLEAAGAIGRYVAVLDHKVLGLENIVFVEVTLNKHDAKVLDEFSDALVRLPEVVEAFIVSGEYDYLVKVAVSGMEHYERFLREGLYKIPGVQHTRSTFAVRTLKEEPSVDPLLVR